MDPFDRRFLLPVKSKKSEVIVVAEHLRQRLNADVLIKSRWYLLRNFSNCCVGRELVDWLIDNGEACNRSVAVQCMRILQDNYLIHHVCDDHYFKDDYLFYRFRIDDDTLTSDPTTLAIIEGYKIYQRLIKEPEGLFKDIEHCGSIYGQVFTGYSLVNWLLRNQKYPNREAAVNFGKILLDNGLIKNITDSFHFQDEEMYYQFTVYKITCSKIMEALGVEGKGTSAPSSPAFLRRTLGNPSLHSSMPSFPVSLPQQKHSRDNPAHGRRTHSVDTPPDSPDSVSDMNNDMTSLQPVILRHVSVEELQDPSGPFVAKSIKVMADAVGYGFVVRGQSPVYIQTVDPHGPAATAGLKVRQYIHSVNGKNVLRWHHKQVADEIFKAPKVITLLVMSHFRGSY